MRLSRSTKYTAASPGYILVKRFNLRIDSATQANNEIRSSDPARDARPWPRTPYNLHAVNSRDITSKPLIYKSILIGTSPRIPCFQAEGYDEPGHTRNAQIKISAILTHSDRHPHNSSTSHSLSSQTSARQAPRSASTTCPHTPRESSEDTPPRPRRSQPDSPSGASRSAAASRPPRQTPQTRA